jgi:hypothetical protein
MVRSQTSEAAMHKMTFVITMCLLSMVLLVPLTARSQGNPFQQILNAIAQVQAQIAQVQTQIAQVETQIAQAQTQIAGIGGPRAFYLTQTEHMGNQVLTACAPGFHMASLWEIWDPSNLRYDTTLGFTGGDAGSGPPSLGGWIRTGNAAGPPIIFDFQDNCVAWTSDGSVDPSHEGTRVTLTRVWDGTALRTHPWTATESLCSVPARVWCVED